MCRRRRRQVSCQSQFSRWMVYRLYMLYRTRLTVPLREVVQIAADDKDLLGVRITEVLAGCLRTWQSKKRTVLAPMSRPLVESHYPIFKGPVIKTPHALLTVAFVPWASDATNLDEALAGPFPVTAASKFHRYHSIDEGLISHVRGYDLFEKELKEAFPAPGSSLTAHLEYHHRRLS